MGLLEAWWQAYNLLECFLFRGEVTAPAKSDGCKRHRWCPTPLGYPVARWLSPQPTGKLSLPAWVWPEELVSHCGALSILSIAYSSQWGLSDSLSSCASWGQLGSTTMARKQHVMRVLTCVLVQLICASSSQHPFKAELLVVLRSLSLPSHAPCASSGLWFWKSSPRIMGVHRLKA